MAEHAPPPPRAQSFRRRVLRSTAGLLAGVVALTLLVVLLRDISRRSTQLVAAGRYASLLQEDRLGELGHLPLNLAPGDEIAEDIRRNRWDWLSHTDAALARDTLEPPIIAAWSDPYRLWLLGTGRVMISFDGQAFAATWHGLASADDLLAAQRERLRAARPAAPPAP